MGQIKLSLIVMRCGGLGEGSFLFGSPAGNGPDDDQRLRPRSDRLGQRGIRRFVGQILLAGEEPQEWPALERDVVVRPIFQPCVGLRPIPSPDPTLGSIFLSRSGST